MSARPAMLAPDVSDAARQLGKLGGRPRGSYSPIGRWLRSEIVQRRREGYRCRESFEILRDTERPDGDDAFFVTEWTADAHGLDLESRVSWANYRKLWDRNR